MLEHHGMARLNRSQVQDIRIKLNNGQSCCNIAKEYGMSHGAIYAIAKGKTWKGI